MCWYQPISDLLALQWQHPPLLWAVVALHVCSGSWKFWDKDVDETLIDWKKAQTPKKKRTEIGLTCKVIHSEGQWKLAAWRIISSRTGLILKQIHFRCEKKERWGVQANNSTSTYSFCWVLPQKMSTQRVLRDKTSQEQGRCLSQNNNNNVNG